MTAPIGFLDSGFGGLSIYKSVVDLLPYESTVYIGDHAHMPYGGKTTLVIRSRVRKLIEFLLSKQAKLIVVACNTATIAGIDEYRTWFPMVPIVGVVPVIKTAALETKKKSFVILSTSFTAMSKYQKELIRRFAYGHKVYNLGCPNLLSFVEKGMLTGDRITQELRGLLTLKIISQIDTVVLGCTHYPFLHDSIRGIVGGKVVILDSGGAVARQVQRILVHNDIATQLRWPMHMFYSTGKNANRTKVARILLHKNIEVQYANV